MVQTKQALHAISEAAMRHVNFYSAGTDRQRVAYAMGDEENMSHYAMLSGGRASEFNSLLSTVSQAAAASLGTTS